MKVQKKLKPLAIDLYKAGECFICKKPCDFDSYAHFECCISYADHKEKAMKQNYEENDN